MAEIYFGDFRVVVNRHIKEIEADNPESHSIEWFLLKYLRRIVKYADVPPSPGRIDNSIRALISFYVDNVETNSPLGERCTEIYEEYRKTLRLKNGE